MIPVNLQTLVHGTKIQNNLCITHKWQMDERTSIIDGHAFIIGESLHSSLIRNEV